MPCIFSFYNRVCYCIDCTGQGELASVGPNTVAMPVVTRTTTDDGICCHTLSKTSLLQLSLRRGHAPKLERLATHDGYDNLLDQLFYLD